MLTAGRSSCRELGRKCCYLIDSGTYGSEEIIKDYLHSIGRSVSDIRAIFLTHAHPDHIGTAAYFQYKAKCKIYASVGERRWIEDVDLQFRERPIPNFYQLAGKSSVVDCVAADEDRIELEEDFTVQVLGTPGHSADEVTYIIDGSAFIGDSVPVTGDIPIYVNKDDTLDSLRRLEELSAVHTFYPAWDKAYTREEMQVKISEARNLIGMLQTATATVRKEIPGGNLEQIVQQVCEKVNMPQLMQNPLFKMTIKSHLESCQNCKAGR